MKIMLIAPASGKWRNVGRSRWFGGRTFRFSLLSLLSVAAETPAGVDLRIVDEQIEDIPWDDDVDLVGITCMTALAPRAYEIAARFRERNVRVVLGGVHPTLNPSEAARHADAIVVGDAEGVWSRVVADARGGRLNGVYRRQGQATLNGLKRPRYDLLRRGRYATAHAVQATRGCPHECDFCAVSAFHGHTQRRRPVEEVVAEVGAIPSRFFIFVDDNLTAERDYAAQLFRALAPLRKQWVTQSTLAVAQDAELVRLAAAAGCVGLFVGLETFSERNLESVNKTCHRVEEYRRSIRVLHSHGIGVEAGIVFGFEADRKEVFAATLSLLDRLEVDVIQASIFTPLPGTPRYEAMQTRILDRDWGHYDFHHVVFRPRHLTPRELQDGHDWVTREFYRPWRIVRRVLRHVRRPHGWATASYLLAINAAYYGRVRKWRIRGCNPGARSAPTFVWPATAWTCYRALDWVVGTIKRARVPSAQI